MAIQNPDDRCGIGLPGTPLSGYACAVLHKPEVIAAIAEDRSKNEVRQVFQHILDRGVLAYARPGKGKLVVPAPSMHNWLVDCYHDRPSA